MELLVLCRKAFWSNKKHVLTFHLYFLHGINNSLLNICKSYIFYTRWVSPKKNHLAEDEDSLTDYNASFNSIHSQHSIIINSNLLFSFHYWVNQVHKYLYKHIIYLKSTSKQRKWICFSLELWVNVGNSISICDLCMRNYSNY